MFFGERNEICGRITSQSGFDEVRIGGKKIFGLAMEIGEVAAAATGDEDLLAESVGSLENGDTAAALTGFDGAHQTGGAAAEDQSVKGVS